MDKANYFEWTKVNIPNIYKLKEKLNSSLFKGKTIYINIPLTCETTVLIHILKELQTRLVVVPLTSGKTGSLKEGVIPLLKSWGNIIHYSKATEENRIKALSYKPDILFDCIGYATQTAIDNNLIDNIKIGILELTRSGVVKHEEWGKNNTISKPVIPIDNCPVKRLGEDRYGSGLALLRCLLDLNIYIPGKKIAIVGFGPIGNACAMYLKAINADVYVLEKDPLRKLVAAYEGCRTKNIKSILKECDIVITATGQKNVLDKEEFDLLKEGVIIANMGAEPGEWNQNVFENDGEEIIPFLKKRYYKGKAIYELTSGNTVNLVWGIFATPIEIMDMTFSVAIKAMEYLFRNPKKFVGLRDLPESEYRKSILSDFK